MNHTPGDPPTEAASLAATAKRMSRWATNLLATGVILIAGLVFGRQTIQWWRADSGGATSADHVAAVVGAEPIGAAGEATLLEFGDSPYVLRRSECDGDADEALARLRQLCRAAAEGGDELDSAVADAEQRMLAATRKMTPVEQLGDGQRIYQIAQPLPMVTVVRSSPETTTGEAVTAQDRVVSWGLAMPVATEQQQTAWTLLACAVGDSQSKSSGGSARRSPLPAPPGGRRSLSIGTEHGGSIVGFTGTGQPLDWTEFYDRWFQQQSWSPSAAWQRGERVWRRRYEQSPAAADVLIQADASGSLRAMVMLVEPLGSRGEVE